MDLNWRRQLAHWHLLQQIRVKGVAKNTNVKQPVYAKKNTYLCGSKAFEREDSACILNMDPKIKIEEDGTVFLSLYVPKELLRRDTHLYCTEDFEAPRITEGAFENPDGTKIVWNRDYFGNKRERYPLPCPFEELQEGLKIIWTVFLLSEKLLSR